MSPFSTWTKTPRFRFLDDFERCLAFASPLLLRWDDGVGRGTTGGFRRNNGGIRWFLIRRGFSGGVFGR